MAGGHWMIRTVRSGKVIEKSQFYVGPRKPRSPKKKGSTSAARKDKNMNTAIRNLARIINCNWSRGDILLTLTYDERHIPETSETAEHLCALFWRRLGRTLKEVNVRLCGFWTACDKDENGNSVRLHHHCVLSAAGIDVKWNEDGTFDTASVGGRTLSDIWGRGTVNVELLREQDDYTPIAAYILRQVVSGEDKKKWHASRDLEKPVVESEIITVSPRELRAPGGALVSEIGRYDAETGSHYIRYIRRPKCAKVGGSKERSVWEPVAGEEGEAI